MFSSLQKDVPQFSISSILDIPPPQDSPYPNITFYLLLESKKDFSHFFPIEFMNITAWKTDFRFDLPRGSCIRIEVVSGLSSYIGENEKIGESISEQIGHLI
jgi:hypothetical protein